MKNGNVCRATLGSQFPQKYSTTVVSKVTVCGLLGWMQTGKLEGLLGETKAFSQHSLETCEMGFCLPGRATSFSPLPVMNGASSSSLLAYASGNIKTHINIQAPLVPISTDCHAYQSHWALLAHKPPSGSSYLPDSSSTMKTPRMFQSCPLHPHPSQQVFFITSKACFSLHLRWPWQSPPTL